MKIRIVTMVIAMLALALPAWGQELSPVEIMVRGRQPGPPMWRVVNGDNVLWIFPYLSPVPKDMIWESERVDEVIAQAEEFISAPDIDVDAPLLLMLNPINIFRGIRLGKRLSRNPGDATLDEVLPPDVYARYAALKSVYFQKEKDLEELRPFIAASQMASIIQRESDLVSGRDIRRKISRQVSRNRGIRETDIEVTMMIEGNFRSLADRAEKLMNSLSREQELVCFEYQLNRMERDLDEMKARANSWAQGYVDEFRGIPLPGGDEDPCQNLVFASSEAGTIEELLAEAQARWMAAVEKALANNRITFAVLPINQLVDENGVVATFRDKGYEVREP